LGDGNSGPCVGLEDQDNQNLVAVVPIIINSFLRLCAAET